MIFTQPYLLFSIMWLVVSEIGLECVVLIFLT
ncbi:MAG: hypothetical protein PWR04_1739 [Anaerophaga sp.]|nr:hypothetical protein [Anaerophaga sp.]